MTQPRLVRTIGAINIGSFRVSAMIAGVTETGELIVLGSAHRASQGVKRGYVVDLDEATFAVRDALEKAERLANVSINSVYVGCSGLGLTGEVAFSEVEISGRRIDQDDIRLLLRTARAAIQPKGRAVLHAQAAHYSLDGAEGVADPLGLHANTLGVAVYVMQAEVAPVRNLKEAVQKAHLGVLDVVGSPIATGHACLSPEERDLGVALVEIGSEVTNVSVYAAGMLLGLDTIRMGSGDITDAIASNFGIRRFQAERLKCVNGSALSSRADSREMIPINAPGEDGEGIQARYSDDKNRIPRSELISVIATQLGTLMSEINKSLKNLGFGGVNGQQVVLTGGGAELVGLADFAQGALGKSVRLGRPQSLPGLAEAHLKPGFSTLVGLILYAEATPSDIRSIAPDDEGTIKYPGSGLVRKVLRAIREYF